MQTRWEALRADCGGALGFRGSASRTPLSAFIPRLAPTTPLSGMEKLLFHGPLALIESRTQSESQKTFGVHHRALSK